MKVFDEGKEHRVSLLLGSNARELQTAVLPHAWWSCQAIAEHYGPLADRALALYGLKAAPSRRPIPLSETP